MQTVSVFIVVVLLARIGFRRRPVRIHFFLEILFGAVDIALLRLGEGRKGRGGIVAPRDDIADRLLCSHADGIFQALLIRGVAGLRSVLFQSLDIHRIQRCGAGKYGIQVHIEIEQDVADGERRSVAEHDIVLDRKVVVGVEIRIVVRVRLRLFRAGRERRIIVYDARLVFSPGEIAVFIRSDHAELRLTDHRAVRTGRREEGIENAVHRVDGNTDGRIFRHLLSASRSGNGKRHHHHEEDSVSDDFLH